MGKLFLLNRSHRSGHISVKLNCIQFNFSTSNFRRSSLLGLLEKTKDILRECQTKRALSMKIPRNNINAGLPKLSNRYGNGVLVVAETTRNFCSYTSKVTFTECEAKQEFKNKKIDLLQKEGLSNYCKQRKKKIYKKLLDKNFLLKILLKERNTVNMNLVGIEKNLEKVILMLKDHSFKFKPVKKVNGLKKKQPCSTDFFPSFIDKIVLKAMSNLLNEIFEPKFNKNSHGFRPNKSCHSALETIKK